MRQMFFVCFAAALLPALLLASPSTYILTVTKSGTGTGTVSDGGLLNCGATCSYTYDIDTDVVLTATADVGSHFVEWTGACTGADCEVTMDMNRNVEAVFTCNEGTINPLDGLCGLNNRGDRYEECSAAGVWIEKCDDPDVCVADDQYCDSGNLLLCEMQESGNYDYSTVTCADTNDCTADSCDDILGCQNDPVAEFTPCGDQSDTVCDAPDTCDGAGNCQYNYEPITTPCRVAAGACDLTENCTGAGECAIDGVADDTTVCNASLGACDPAEYCNGTDKTCPADVISGDTVPCRPAAGACDAVEYCDGINTDCTPLDLKLTDECRAATGSCDVAEYCDGEHNTCPGDGVAGNTVVCRDATDVCDAVEKCTGSSKSCPADVAKPDTTVCRPADGDCDIADNCDGTSKACPTDAVMDNSVTCRAAAGDCDVAEHCSGIGPDCPADGFAAINTPCGDSTNTLCNNADTCDGNGTCLDNFAPDTLACRTATGLCDAVEYCDGAGSCPADELKTTADVCRPSIGTCDAAEYCDGVSDACPAENYASVNGDECVDGYDYTDTETCMNGVCSGAEVVGSCETAYAVTTLPYTLESSTIGRPSHIDDYSLNCPFSSAPLGDAVLHVAMESGKDYTISITRHGGWTGFIAIIPMCNQFFTNTSCLNTNSVADSFTYSPAISGNATIVVESVSAEGDFTLTIEEVIVIVPDDTPTTDDDGIIPTDEIVTDDIVTDETVTDNVLTDDIVTDDIMTDEIVTDEDLLTDEEIDETVTDDAMPMDHDMVMTDDKTDTDTVATDNKTDTNNAGTDNETPDETSDTLLGDEDTATDTTVVDTDKPKDEGCGCTVVF